MIWKWNHMPTVEYTRDDGVEFLVDRQGMLVRVVYFFKVADLLLLCPYQTDWIISTSSEDFNDLTS
jgi:hypothetical protein